ncbi:MAG: glycosyltransferase family 39 protein, partial [bacterium]
ILLHCWALVAQDEIWLRMSSVLFHLASIPLIFLVGRRLLGREAGIVAAALLACSPFHLGFARELRMYSLVGFLSLLSMEGLLAWLQDRSRRGWWTWGLAGLALLYTHFMGVLLLVAQLAIVVTGEEWRRRRGDVLRWMALLIIGFLPWSLFFVKAFVVTHGYGGEAPLHHLVYALLRALTVGFGQADWLNQSGQVLAVVMLVGLWSLPSSPARNPLALWALVPLALELILTVAGKPVFAERTLITSTPAWLLIAAWMITAASSRWIRSGFAIAVGLLAGMSYAHLVGGQLPASPAHGAALADVLKDARPGDAIVHSSNVTYHPVHSYYLRRAAADGVVPDFYLEPAPAVAGGGGGGGVRARWRAWRD